jgi:MFS family permease
MLGAYFWGYLFTPLLGGMMAEKFGGKNVIGISAILSALVTFLTPLFAQKNYWPIFAARFLTGFLAVNI